MACGKCGRETGGREGWSARWFSISTMYDSMILPFYLQLMSSILQAPTEHQAVIQAYYKSVQAQVNRSLKPICKTL